MRSLIIRIIISAIVIAVVTSGVVPGIRIEGNIPTTWIALTVIFTVVNVIIKPILVLLTCPFIVLTLGLIGFFINVGLLYLTAFLGNQLISLTGGRLVIETFLNAMVASVIITLTTIFLEQFLQVNGQRRREQVKVQKVTEVRYVVQQQRAELDADFERRIAQNNPPTLGFNDVSAQNAPYGYQPPAQPPSGYAQPQPPQAPPPQVPPSYDQPPPPAAQPPRPFGSQAQTPPRPRTGTPDDWDFDDPAFPKGR